MATYILKRKMYSLLGNGSGVSISRLHQNWEAGGGKEKLGDFKTWYKGEIGNINTANAQKEAQRAAQRTMNKLNPGAAAAKATSSRVGVFQGLKNTFNNSSKLGKAGMIATGVAAGGLMLNGAANLGNKKQ